MTNLTPQPGHVVAIPAPGYRCDFCGAPATWDIPTRMGPWANACDACEPRYHTAPGQTGVGIGQRLIIEQDEERPEPGTVGAILAGKGVEPASDEPLAQEALREMGLYDGVEPPVLGPVPEDMNPEGVPDDPEDDEPCDIDRECLDARKGNCEGPVEYRPSLSGTGTPIPRCDRHWADRLAWQEQHNRDYPDSPIPPAWFDPEAAGEVWDEEA